jgi:adenylosuccinate synthase
MNVLENVEVEYVTFQGWMTPICACRTFDALPENAKKYVLFIEEFLGVPGN